MSMQLTPTWREGVVGEIRGAAALGLIAVVLLLAFAWSPLGTMAALLFGGAAYAHRGSGGEDAQKRAAVWRLTLGLAMLGTMTLLVRFGLT